VLSDKVDNKAWKIDCLPCGYLRIFPGSGYKLQADSIPVSDYSLYAVKIEGQTSLIKECDVNE
jgi:hypothetical protein